MAYNRNQARPLLTDAEYELFSASLADRIGDLNAADLDKAITRTRKARDKASDNKRRQASTVQKKAGARGVGQGANERSVKKKTMLAETLTRYEKRLAKVEAAEARDRRASVLTAAKAAKKAPRKQATAPNRAARRATKATKGFASKSAQAEATAARRAPQTRITSSQAAAGRRGQAKRDKR